MTVTIPGRIPWVAHRVAVSGHYHDSLRDILEHWPLELLVDASDVCDALDAVRAPKER